MTADATTDKDVNDKSQDGDATNKEGDGMECDDQQNNRRFTGHIYGADGPLLSQVVF